MNGETTASRSRVLSYLDLLRSIYRCINEKPNWSSCTRKRIEMFSSWFDSFFEKRRSNEWLMDSRHLFLPYGNNVQSLAFEYPRLEKRAVYLTRMLKNRSRRLNDPWASVVEIEFFEAMISQRKETRCGWWLNVDLSRGFHCCGLRRWSIYQREEKRISVNVSCSGSEHWVYSWSHSQKPSKDCARFERDATQ